MKRIREFLLRENSNADSTDSVFEFLAEISNQVQEEFDKLLGEDTNKKRFLRSLSKIFDLVLNVIVNIAEKIKKTIKIALETTAKMFSGQKQQ